VTREDVLDAALESDLAALAASPELRDLIETGVEIGGALGAWRLDGDIRARIYAAAIALMKSGQCGKVTLTPE
jgi:hypothetical protein